MDTIFVLTVEGKENDNSNKSFIKNPMMSTLVELVYLYNTNKKINNNNLNLRL